MGGLSVAQKVNPPDKDGMDALTALRLQIEWGADEALADLAFDRLMDQSMDRPAGVVPFAQSAQVAVAPVGPVAPVVAAARPVAVPAAKRALPAPALRAREIAEAATSIDGLRAALAGFDGCALKDTATNLVFADGNPASGLMLVGEGPGAEEDRAGLPFVGPSGQLLSRMLGSIGMTRADCLITNLIPWRPPGNRNPTEAETQMCLPFLLRHIALVRPKRLVLLGALSAKAVLGGSLGILKMRGKWVEVTIPGLDAPIPALPMLHPAYLLRSPGAKRDAWADWLLLHRTIAEDRPK